MKKILLIITLLLFIPALAFPHAGMKKCTPEKNAVLTTAPDKVIIEFAGEVEPAFSKIEVFDQDKNKVSLKTEYIENNTITETGLNEDLVPGKYKVKWKIMSLDGHKLSGKFSFTIK